MNKTGEARRGGRRKWHMTYNEMQRLEIGGDRDEEDEKDEERKRTRGQG